MTEEVPATATPPLKVARPVTAKVEDRVALVPVRAPVRSTVVPLTAAVKEETPSKVIPPVTEEVPATATPPLKVARPVAVDVAVLSAAVMDVTPSKVIPPVTEEVPARAMPPLKVSRPMCVTPPSMVAPSKVMVWPVATTTAAENVVILELENPDVDMAPFGNSRFPEASVRPPAETTKPPVATVAPPALTSKPPVTTSVLGCPVTLKTVMLGAVLVPMTVSIRLKL